MCVYVSFPLILVMLTALVSDRSLISQACQDRQKLAAISTMWFEGPCVTPERGVLKAQGRRQNGSAALPCSWQSRSLWSPFPNEYGGDFTQPRTVGFVSLHHSSALRSGVTLIITFVLTSDLNTSQEKRKKKVGVDWRRSFL